MPDDAENCPGCGKPDDAGSRGPDPCDARAAGASVRAEEGRSAHEGPRRIDPMMAVSEESVTAILRFHRDHHVRFVLCDNDGAEVDDVEPERVKAVARYCELIGRGFIKQVHVALSSVPQVIP